MKQQDLSPALPTLLAIETQGLSRSYTSYNKDQGLRGSLRGFWRREHIEKLALAPTTLSIQQGQIVGLVGANGAGKTTLLKLLAGLVFPSQGQAKVLGYTPWERKNDYLRQMSLLLGQKNQLWWDISANDSFSLLADIYDLEPKKARARVDELATLLDCTHVLKTQLRRLSLGERMKMELIGALLHEPRILFLDEPTIGLDIVAQTAIRKFIADYVREKKPTVILTSHYMDDITKLADRLLLISKGQIVYDGTVNGFMSKTPTPQKILFSLAQPLKNPLALESKIWPVGTQEFSLEVMDGELNPALRKIIDLPGMQDLRLEQVDFEDVIHQFLKKGEVRP